MIAWNKVLESSYQMQCIFLFADFEQTFYMDFCGSPVMRTTVGFSFNKFRRWLLVALCFGSGWKGRAYSVHISTNEIKFFNGIRGLF